jgi:REP element-mobilizing transposase RayT
VPPRKPRRKPVRLYEEAYARSGALALLTACTASRRRVFGVPDRADLVTTEIGHLHGENWRILGYCVMPDHVHLLAFNIQGSLLDLMRLFKGRTAKGLRGEVTGTLWQRGFHDHLLRRNEDISRTLLYMFENPVRAGLVEAWTQFSWCGSFQWPEIDPEFFSVRPEDVHWNEVFGAESGSGD